MPSHSQAYCKECHKQPVKRWGDVCARCSDYLVNVMGPMRVDTGTETQRAIERTERDYQGGFEDDELSMERSHYGH